VFYLSMWEEPASRRGGAGQEGLCLPVGLARVEQASSELGGCACRRYAPATGATETITLTHQAWSAALDPTGAYLWVIGNDLAGTLTTSFISKISTAPAAKGARILSTTTLPAATSSSCTVRPVPPAAS
jgi:hypothetical protein